MVHAMKTTVPGFSLALRTIFLGFLSNGMREAKTLTCRDGPYRQQRA